jgi:hypothetical protein
VFNKFQTFVKREETQSRLKLKRLHSNNGLKYKNTNFHKFLNEKEVVTTYSALYTHEQNGLAEIFNRMLITKVRALLIQALLAKSY